MKLTHEKLAALKTLKLPDWLARKDDPWAHEAARAIPDLIADLEEARKQLAEAQALLFNISEDTPCKCNEHSKQADEFLNRTGHKALDSILDAAIAEAIEPYRKDTERLDLLGKLCKETLLRPNAFCSEIAPDTRLRYDFPTLVSYDSVGNQISLRNAIDAAIAAKGESEYPPLDNSHYKV